MKITSLMLALSLVSGVAVFAADEKPMDKPMKSEKKAKKAKKEAAPKTDEKK